MADDHDALDAEQRRSTYVGNRAHKHLGHLGRCSTSGASRLMSDTKTRPADS